MTLLRRLYNLVRTWWLRRRARIGQPGEVVAVAPPEYRRPFDITLHWCSDGTGMPHCGQPVPARWTIDFWATNCSACKARGFPLLTKHMTNTR